MRSHLRHVRLPSRRLALAGAACLLAPPAAFAAFAAFAQAYLFNRRTSLTTALSVSALQGDARNSPLVRQATTASGVMVLSHAF